MSNEHIGRIFNEDVIHKGFSDKSVLYMKNQGFDIYQNDPPIGLGESMKRRILESKSDYIFYLQDDWEFERPIDVDRIIWTMNRNNINCVTFNKYRNMKPTDFVDKEVDFDGMKMCLYNGWQFLPGIWRTRLVKYKFEQHGTRKERPEGYWQNLFGTHQERLNHEHLESAVRAYMYGGLGEYRYVRHIGGSWRTAEWRRKDDYGSGEIHWDFMNLKRDRAPWLSPMEKRPLNESVKLSKQGMEYYEKADDHIKEIFKDALPKN